MTPTLPLQSNGTIVPRPYQEEALEALDRHIIHKDTNPCVVIPTGGGKSILIAWSIQQWKKDYPALRVCILAHRKELIVQNAEEMTRLWPACDVGIYSAGLGRKDVEHSVLFASIDSIYKRWGEIAAFDVLIIDEAHRIPAGGEGKYHEFIKGCQLVNKKLKVIGYTATAFRMGCGPICHKDHILNEVIYEANVGTLITDGYLCQLRSKVGDVQPNLDNVRRKSGGDYIVKSLAEAVDTKCVIAQAVQSAMKHIADHSRRSVVFFCVDVHHCQQVSLELRKHGMEAPCITAKTPSAERSRIAGLFRSGHYRAICNVNVFTEGFNVHRIDGIVLFRPTLSRGLYVQMVGRGLRPYEDKDYCLVLDYAHCIDEHGPIDCIDPGNVRMVICGGCTDSFSMAVRKCPNCGWDVPKIEIERVEAEVREKKMHESEASNRNILGSEPETVKVSDVSVHRHTRPDRPDSIRVQYRCGMSVFKEWICLDHGGVAEQKARRWWQYRFGPTEAKTITVNQALEDMFLGDRIGRLTETITVIRRKKYADIIEHQLINSWRTRREAIALK